jgi:hypothetical protein
MASQRNRGRGYSTVRPELPAAPGELMKLAGRPADVIAHPAWSEARETIIAEVNAGHALIALLGPPGTGKTVLLRDLATRFAELGRAVCLLEFGDSPQDVGAAEIVLVDEADRISASRLDELRSLKGVSVVLAALPASRDRFARYPGASVVQLALLSPDEACKFLVERLEQLGLPKRTLTDAAWAQLIAHAHGAPRLLVALLGHALFLASEHQAARVTAPHVDEAVAARGGELKASTVEPARAEPDRMYAGVPVIVAGVDVSASAPERDLAAPTPPPGRLGASLVVGSYVAAVVAVYALPVAALLTWGLPWHTGKTAPPGLEAPALARTHVEAATAGTEQIVAITPEAATPTPQADGAWPAGLGAADQTVPGQPAPAPPVAAPIGPDNAAYQQATAQNQAQAEVVAYHLLPPSRSAAPADRIPLMSGGGVNNRSAHVGLSKEASRTHLLAKRHRAASSPIAVIRVTLRKWFGRL